MTVTFHFSARMEGKIYGSQSHQANNVGQDVFVRKDLGLLRLRQLLQVGIGLVQQQVNQITESLLKQD